MGLIFLCNILETVQQCDQWRDQLLLEEQPAHWQHEARQEWKGLWVRHQWCPWPPGHTLRLLVISDSVSSAKLSERLLDTPVHCSIHTPPRSFAFSFWIDRLLQSDVRPAAAPSILHSQQSPPAGINNTARKSFLFLGLGLGWSHSLTLVYWEKWAVCSLHQQGLVWRDILETVSQMRHSLKPWSSKLVCRLQDTSLSGHLPLSCLYVLRIACVLFIFLYSVSLIRVISWF